MPTVGELMNRDLIKVSRDTTVAGAASVMSQRRVGSVLIMEGDELEGIFTERDIVRALSHDIAAPREEIVHWMTRNPLTVPEATDAREALQLMSDNHFRHLPVTDVDGRLVGIVSIRDMIRRGVTAESWLT